MEMEFDCVIIDGYLLGYFILFYSYICEEQNVFIFSLLFVLGFYSKFMSKEIF